MGGSGQESGWVGVTACNWARAKRMASQRAGKLGMLAASSPNAFLCTLYSLEEQATYALLCSKVPGPWPANCCD